MSGYCSKGSEENDMAPTKRIMMAIEMAITGRLMKMLPFIAMS